MKSVATNEAKAKLSALLEEVRQGETIVITRGRKPVAKLVPYDQSASRAKVGDVMDAPFAVPDEALRPMTAAESRDWGL